MKIIPLTQGKVALVDDEDFVLLDKFKWQFQSQGYARRKPWNKVTKRYDNIYMHRLIMNAPKELHIDHINGDRLDNRKLNLRLCLQKDNNKNIRRNLTNSSGFKGVFWHKIAKKWMAEIVANGNKFYLGLFLEKTDAARAYNEAAIKYHGIFANLNKL